MEIIRGKPKVTNGEVSKSKKDVEIPVNRNIFQCSYSFVDKSIQITDISIM